MFTSKSYDENGHTYIFRTDDEGEFIKHAIQSHYFDSRHKDHVTVSSLGGDWYRVTVDLSHLLSDSEDLFDTALNIDSVLSKNNKGWYECRDEGEEVGTYIKWYEVRHVGGPYV